MRQKGDSQTTPGDTVSASCPARAPRRLIMYVIGVDLSAIVVLLATFQTLPPHLWLDLVVFISFAVLAESWTAPMRCQGEISLSFPVYYAAAIVLGPFFGALTAAGACLIADGIVRRKGVVKTAFGAGQFALCAGLAGLTFDALKSDPGFDLTSNALAYAAAAAVYIVLNSALAAGTFSLIGRPSLKPWFHALREGGIFYIAMVPLGALVANAYTHSPWTVLYFPPLIWVFYKGFRLFAQLRTETDKALVVLANTIDKRDRYTYQHSARVAKYVAQIATRLALTTEEIDLIVSAAHMHDLGKISIDNRILLKEGPISAEERRQINMHAAAGAELAGQFSMYREGADIIRHHHERWDGNGYPDGLAGDAIPLGARIIAVADVYDAMTSDRPYRAALTREAALAEIVSESGTHFDAKVVEAFLATAEAESSVPVS